MRKNLKKALWDCHNAVGSALAKYNTGHKLEPEDIEILEQVAWILRRMAEGFPNQVRFMDKGLCQRMEERNGY